MAKVVNNTDRLTFILTSYGLGRVAEALKDTSVKIMLSKIKAGDANYEYYEPDENATDLVHPIEGGEFYIIEKDLLEDDLTISLHAVMPEDFDDCEVREVGVYETVNGADKLFAISTQQPLLKPSIDLNYFIAVDYFAFIKSANLAEIYDQIILDPDNQVVTEDDFDKLIRTILFSQANLMEQIHGNSRVLGLNRVQQLKDLMDVSKNNFSNMAAGNNYTLLLNDANINNIFSYWLFNYPRKVSSAAAITDLGKEERNLYVSKSINSFDRIYNGLTPMLTFTPSDYFYLPQTDNVAELDMSDFTVAGHPDISSTGKVTAFSENDYLTLPPLTITSGNTYALTFSFYLGTNQMSQSIVYFESNYSIACLFDSQNSCLTVRVGNGTTWKNSITYPIQEAHEYTVKLLFNNSRFSLDFLENGEYIEKAYVNLNYSIPSNLGKLIIGAPNGSYFAFNSYMKLMPVDISENGITIYSGSKYSSINSLTFINAEGTADTPFTMLYSVEPLETGVNRTILARSNYSTNSNMFEITETANNALQVRLFSDSENYITFTSGNNVIPTTAHAVGFNYNADEKTITAYVAGDRKSVV